MDLADRPAPKQATTTGESDFGGLAKVLCTAPGCNLIFTTRLCDALRRKGEGRDFFTSPEAYASFTTQRRIKKRSLQSITKRNHLDKKPMTRGTCVSETHKLGTFHTSPRIAQNTADEGGCADQRLKIQDAEMVPNLRQIY